MTTLIGTVKTATMRATTTRTAPTAAVRRSLRRRRSCGEGCACGASACSAWSSRSSSGSGAGRVSSGAGEPAASTASCWSGCVTRSSCDIFLRKTRRYRHEPGTNSTQCQHVADPVPTLCRRGQDAGPTGTERARRRRTEHSPGTGMGATIGPLATVSGRPRRPGRCPRTTRREETP